MTEFLAEYTGVPGQVLKESGWCEKNNVAHSWVMAETLTTNPPIATRRCINCGKTQQMQPGQWVDG